VDGARGGERDPAHARDAHGLQHAQRRDDVLVDVHLGAQAAGAHVGVGRDVPYHVRALHRQREVGGVQHVRVHEMIAGVPLVPGEEGLLAGAQVVVDDDLVAPREEGVREVRADEPGSSRHDVPRDGITSAPAAPVAEVAAGAPVVAGGPARAAVVAGLELALARGRAALLVAAFAALEAALGPLAAGLVVPALEAAGAILALGPLLAGLGARLALLPRAGAQHERGVVLLEGPEVQRVDDLVAAALLHLAGDVLVHVARVRGDVHAARLHGDHGQVGLERQEVLGEDGRLLALRDVLEEEVHVPDVALVELRAPRVAQDGDDVRARLAHAQEVAEAARAELHGDHDALAHHVAHVRRRRAVGGAQVDDGRVLLDAERAAALHDVGAQLALGGVPRAELLPVHGVELLVVDALAGDEAAGEDAPVVERDDVGKDLARHQRSPPRNLALPPNFLGPPGAPPGPPAGGRPVKPPFLAFMRFWRICWDFSASARVANSAARRAPASVLLVNTSARAASATFAARLRAS